MRHLVCILVTSIVLACDDRPGSAIAELDSDPDRGADTDPRALPCPVAAAGPAQPYPWYPALDLARVPFHVAAGAYGAQAPITAPAAPITTRSVTVHSSSALAQEALVPGTEVIVGSDIPQTTTLLGDVSDLDLVVPAGRSLGAVYVGRFTPASTTTRVRIRGTTPMTHSGGRVGSLVFLSNPTRDVIIDGVDLNGEDGAGGSGLFQFSSGVERAAVVNVRGHGVSWGSLNGAAVDMVVAGSSLFTGARTRTQNGIPEGWGLRAGDRILVFRNYIEGTRYHRVRVHPAVDTLQYAWVVENVLVDPYEARIVTAMDIGATTPGTLVDALWAQCNQVYAHSTCLPPSFEAPSAAYGELTHNSFFGSLTEALQTLRQQERPAHDYLTGNTYAAWQAPPAPPADLGDPRQVPLPADDPSDDNSALEGAACPGP